MAVVFWMLLSIAGLARAICECGYSVDQANAHLRPVVFTDMQENDFLHAVTANLTQIGWQAQEYNVSARDARGPFGKSLQVRNVLTNPLKNESAWSGDSLHGGDAGLGLWVRADHPRGLIAGAELVSQRADALFGSFRVGIKLANSSGTCGAFFYYHNNSQEIDMEFLSRQFNLSHGFVNFVLQSPQSVQAGYDAGNTSSYRAQRLSFRPDAMFHEYRFDWFSDHVAFYVDGALAYTMVSNMPTQPGSLFLNHWSNGDPSWSAGPPLRDTVMTVSYVKAYFNSSDVDSSQKQYRKRCPVYNATRVCPIPNQTTPPDPSQGSDGAKTFFFSSPQSVHGSTQGQTKLHNAATVLGRRRLSGATIWFAALFGAFALSW